MIAITCFCFTDIRQLKNALESTVPIPTTSTSTKTPTPTTTTTPTTTSSSTTTSTTSTTTTPTTTTSTISNAPAADCADVLKRGHSTSGLYFITVLGKTLRVFCGQSTGTGGWLVSLRAHLTLPRSHIHRLCLEIKWLINK